MSCPTFPNDDITTVIHFFFFQVLDERSRSATDLAKQQKTLETVQEDLKGQISRLRAEHEDKVEDLEKRLQTALGKAEEFKVSGLKRCFANITSRIFTKNRRLAQRVGVMEKLLSEGKHEPI